MWRWRCEKIIMIDKTEPRIRQEPASNRPLRPPSFEQQWRPLHSVDRRLQRPQMSKALRIAHGPFGCVAPLDMNRSTFR
jgi:hypothetical protein